MMLSTLVIRRDKNVNLSACFDHLFVKRSQLCTKLSFSTLVFEIIVQNDVDRSAL